MSFSVVIPTCNMEAYLPTLVQSLADSGLLKVAAEIIIVDDGSTDGTAARLAELKNGLPASEREKFRPLILPKNMGRFFARLEGARAANADNILFLDTRVTPARDFAEALDRVSKEHPSVVGSVDIDTTRSVFCLYWDRSHKAIFRKHFKDAVRPIVLTEHNYDDYLKGTGVFLCPRKLFIDACVEFEHQDLLSDDTFLMKRIVEQIPITIHPEVRVGWVPRETYREFVWRIWDRGPQFVEYHVFEKRGLFFFATIAGLAAAAGTCVLLIVAPPVGLGVLAAGTLAVAASTALMAKSPGEFLRLAPLHVGVAAAFGAGAVRGIIVNTGRKLGGQKTQGLLRRLSLRPST
jgi:glycosyltransferase involved in cell wall biosynthesis